MLNGELTTSPSPATWPLSIIRLVVVLTWFYCNRDYGHRGIYTVQVQTQEENYTGNRERGVNGRKRENRSQCSYTMAVTITGTLPREDRRQSRRGTRAG